MGQEAGKPALPKPVGGTMDRRSETRRPYISIMPSLNCQDGCVCQHSGEHKRLNNVQEETSSRMCISLYIFHLTATWGAWGWGREGAQENVEKGRE